MESLNSSSSEIRINLTGAWYSSRNAGDQAILVTIRQLLESRIPGLKMTVLCSNSGFVEREHGLHAISQNRNLPGVYLSVFRGDALLIGGGTPFYNDVKHMVYFWTLALACKLGGGKLIVYGASAQRLRTLSARWFTKSILQMANLVTVREQRTETQMRELGVKRQIQCTADPAITLQPCSPERLEMIMRAEGLASNGAPLFAICPHFFSNSDQYRIHHYEQFSDDSIERQRTVLAATADFLTEHGRVILLPMNCDDPDNDLVVQREILSRMQHQDKVQLIERQYKPAEIAGIFSRCRLTIGVRLHALIMAAAVNCPVIAINYAPKVEGFMQLLGSPEDMLRLQTLAFEELRSRIEAWLEQYEDMRGVYEQKVKKLQRRAEWNAQMVADLLFQGGTDKAATEAAGAKLT